MVLAFMGDAIQAKKSERQSRKNKDRQRSESAHLRILHGQGRRLVARPFAFLRARRRADYVKDLGGSGSASGSVPAGMGVPGLTISGSCAYSGRVTASNSIAGAQHEKPLVQQVLLHMPGAAVRLAFIAVIVSATTTDF